MVDWKRLSESALLDRIEQGPRACRRPIDAFGMPCAFHLNADCKIRMAMLAVVSRAVGSFGRIFVQCNETDDGFNRSFHSTYGVIDEY